MKKVSLFIVFMLIVFSFFSKINAQSPKTWYFGQYAAVDFSGASPQNIQGSLMNTPAGCAVSSNEQFYSNGQTIWGVKKGNNLLGNMYSTQSVVFVPTTKADTFYVFTTDAAAGNNGLRYHLINKPNGSSDYTASSKNNLLLSNVSEKLAVVRHCNKKEYWLITHKWNTNEFYTYRIGEKELDTVPVVSAVGSVHSGNTLNAAGYMKASFMNNTIAVAKTGSGTVELFKFDNISGTLYDTILIDNLNSPYGVEFDMEAKVLYVSTLTGDLLQFNIINWSEATINQTKQTISSQVELYGALQIANDMNIYMAKDNSEYLAKIDKPASIGQSCDYIPNAIHLQGKRSEAGLPLVFRDPSDMSINYKKNCFGDTTFFEFGCRINVDSVLWDFGDTAVTTDTSTQFDPFYIYTRLEDYDAMVQVFHCDTVDTLFIKIELLKPPVANFPLDTIMCDNDPINLFAGTADSYLWQDGSTSSTYTVSTPGIYWVELTNNCGKDADTIEITDVIESPKVKLPSDTIICNKDSVLLSSGYDSTYSIIWSSGDTSSSIYVKNAGLYTLNVVDSFNCMGTDNFLLSVEYLPEPDLGSDTSICVGHSIEFNGSANGFHLWQDGSTNPNFVASDSGTYFVTVSNMCGSVTDSITLRIDPCEKIIFVPNAFSPDNDGINDVFKPYSDYLDQYEMWIYNRWGELLFYTNDVNEAWNGYHNGKEAPMGVYVWKIVYEDYYNKSYTQIGNVVLIR